MQRTSSLNPAQLMIKRELLLPSKCIKIPGNNSDWHCLADVFIPLANHYSQGIGYYDWLDMCHVPTLGGGAVWDAQIGS